LRHVLRLYKIKSFYTIESDSLVFERINLIHENLNFPDNKTLLADKKCISIGYLTEDFLENFCEGVLRAYKSAHIVNYMKGWFDDWVANDNLGGICDMSFCKSLTTGWLGQEIMEIDDFGTPYVINNKKRVFDTFIINDTLLDHDERKIIMTTSQFDGTPLKKVNHDNNGSYICFEDGERVYLNSIHCHGPIKKLMSYLFFDHFHFKN